ncbi:hypothetical protein [Kitasatospora griseola]|uniref:hypothetical protein n=1 Tax=Kitasatospora griseola TaxID=2064 RepID=UPI00381A11E6
MAPHRLERAATALTAHLEQHNSPHRLVHTDTGIHLTTTPGLLTGRQRQNLQGAGHTAASLSPPEAAAVTRMLHRTASGQPLDLSPEQIPRLANRRLLAPTGGNPTVHPDVLFALGLARYPLTDTLAPADNQVLGHHVAVADPQELRHVDHPAAVFSGPVARPLPASTMPQPPGSR